MPNINPKIILRDGVDHKLADDALDVLYNLNLPIFQQGSKLVRICQIDGSTHDDEHKSTFGVDHDGNEVRFPTVLDLTPMYLSRILGQRVDWLLQKRRGTYIKINPPMNIMNHILSMAGEWKFPEFGRIASIPFLLADGRLIKDNGIDRYTKVYVAIPESLRSLTLPDVPTQQDAFAALDVLLDLVSEFPFKNEASRSVALSMLMTPVFRAGFPGHPMPLHLTDSPTPGTGKSHLLNTVSQIAIGQNCAMIAMSNDVREFEKRLVGAILSGRPIIGIDNVQQMVTTDLMCHLAEQSLMDIRPLGTSKTVQVRNISTAFANGNNMVIASDLVRRAIKCTLDANVEHPEDRKFTGDPVAKVIADRGKYIMAILTIIKAYIVAGMPDRLDMASFRTWSQYVRSALVWLDQPDPLDTAAELRAADPVKIRLTALIKAWAACVGCTESGHTIRELLAKMDDHGNEEWKEAVLEVAPDKNNKEQVDPTAFGNYLKRHKDVVVSDYKLRMDNSQNARKPKWILSYIGPD